VERIETHQHTKFRQNWSIGGKLLKFLDFSRWPPLPSWIVEFAKFYWLTELCQLLPKLAVHCRDIAIFQIFKMAAAAILDFCNREILLAIVLERVETHQHAKCCQNWAICCEDIKIFRFFKMAAVHHLGFIWNIFGPPIVSTWGSLSLFKIWL